MAEEMNNAEEREQKVEGEISIPEEVIAQIASKALAEVSGAEPASPGLVANIMSAGKASNGIRVSTAEEKNDEVVVKSYVIEAYIGVKYGNRIPDVCWDVQEKIKDEVEKNTGCKVKSVNVTVQNIVFADKKDGGEAAAEE